VEEDEELDEVGLVCAEDGAVEDAEERGEDLVGELWE
jgi:hypothetical protein